MIGPGRIAGTVPTVPLTALSAPGALVPRAAGDPVGGPLSARSHRRWSARGRPARWSARGRPERRRVPRGSPAQRRPAQPLVPLVVPDRRFDPRRDALPEFLL